MFPYRYMRRLYLRLELQVKVNLCGVQSHTRSAQDDVKHSLVQKKCHNICHIQSTTAKCQDEHVKLRTRPYL